MITFVLTVIVGLFTAVYLWAKYVNGYWERNNVPYIPAKPLIGNLGKILSLQQGVADLFSEMYNNEIGRDSPVVGIQVVHKPALLIKDPELIKNMLVKDFNSFSDRYSTSDPHSDTLGSYSLFFAKNPIWRLIRNKLTPIFTSARMKQMFYLVAEVGNNLDKTLCATDSNDISKQDLRDYSARYTTDVIATCAYGVNAMSIEDPNSEFRKNGRKIFDTKIARAFELMCFFLFPQIVSLFKLKVFSKDSTAFIKSTINHVIDEREKSGAKRHDLIDTLIQLKNEKEDNSTLKFHGDMLIAQAAIFFSAGFETTSALISFALYELAWQPKLQDRLRQEIKEELQKKGGNINYDSLNSMEYLNMVCMETLRLYPPLPYLDRECTEQSGYSLKPFIDFTIPYRTPVFIPMFSIQRDPKFYPNPNEFDPERFIAEKKHDINPYTYMPFGSGPHNCIGERFGLMSGKSGLINFLRNHKVSVHKDTIPRNRLNKKAFLITPEKGIFLTVTKDQLI